MQLLEELDGEFEELRETEDITALNDSWLRSQEDLLVLDEEGVDLSIAEQVSRIRDLPERPAEAAEKSRLEAPEFELVLRELCSVAGHTRVTITKGDPHYEHNREPSLAWHFSREQGGFLLVEDEDEAFLINPGTREIVAAVEFGAAGNALPGSGGASQLFWCSARARTASTLPSTAPARAGSAAGCAGTPDPCGAGSGCPQYPRPRQEGCRR